METTDEILIAPEKVLTLENFLGQRLRGQAKAVQVLSRAVARTELTGVRRRLKPKSAWFMAGPTGVGKTESAQLMAEHLYGSRKDWRDGGHFAAFDMAEYAESGGIAQMLGRSRDEQGVLGDAMDALNEKGGGIILFDEIEKAHSEISLMFLGLLDAARVTMKNGFRKSAENMYLIFTSNVGAAKAAQMERSPEATIHRAILQEAEKKFRPEFMARFSERIVFMRLERSVQVEICRDYLPALFGRICEKQHLREIQCDDDTLLVLAERAYSKTAGARFVQTTLDSVVGNAIIEWIPTRKNEGRATLRLEVVKNGENRELRATEIAVKN